MMRGREMRYLRDQLPVVMAQDRRLDAFLAPFDQIAGDLYEFIAAKEHLFDLTVAPLELVRFLAHQIGVEIEPDLDESLQRRLAITAARTFPRRGTRESIEANVAALTGCDARVVDPNGIRVTALPDVPDVDDRHRVPGQAAPTEPAAPPNADTVGVVRVLLESYGDAPVAAVRAAIERELSCTVVYEIEIIEE